MNLIKVVANVAIYGISTAVIVWLMASHADVINNNMLPGGNIAEWNFFRIF